MRKDAELEMRADGILEEIVGEILDARVNDPIAEERDSGVWSEVFRCDCISIRGSVCTL